MSLVTIHPKAHYVAQFDIFREVLSAYGQTATLLDNPADSTNVEMTDPGYWAIELQPAQLQLSIDGTNFDPSTRDAWLSAEADVYRLPMVDSAEPLTTGLIAAIIGHLPELSA